MTPRFLPLLALLISAPALLMSQDLPSFGAHAVDGDISIDGSLDDPAWQGAEVVTDFLQFEPTEGAAASQRTEVRVLYGNGYVYVGAMLYDDNPDAIEQALGRRDDYNRADWFLVSIDSYFSRQSAFTFGVNAAGVQFDALRESGGGGGGPGGPGGGGGGSNAPRGMDPSWDAIWNSATRVTSDGWVAEMRIPYSMLRFPEAESQTWGFHFTRRIPRLGEVLEWPLVTRSERSNLIARFGLMTGITDIEPRSNIQVRPYAVTRLNTFEDPSDPGSTEFDNTSDIGGDIKLGLGPNVTLDATINPDFGQVESDPAQLNLTAFETFFQEKRPFFLEGAQIYEFRVGPGNMFYSRRVGAQAPIIGATKLSGRTSEGLEFGILGALTGDDFDPERTYTVARLRQQFSNFSTVGGLLTGFDGPARGGGRIQSITGGTDWDIRLENNQYGVEGFGTFTHRNWTAEGVDPETGFATQIQLRKRQGTLSGFAAFNIFSDEFNPNDLGQFRANNALEVVSSLDYDINGGQSFGPFQRARAGMFANQQFSYDEGLNTGQRVRLNSNWTLLGFQQIMLNATFQNFVGGYDLFETRGLGPWKEPASVQIFGNFETDERLRWQLSPEAGTTFHAGGGREYSLGLEGNIDIGSRFALSGSVEGDWEEGVTAWTSNESFMRTGTGEWLIGTASASPDDLGGDYIPIPDPDADAQLDNILLGEVDPYATDTYFVPVFGERDTRSLDLTLRGTVTFTSKLSLQVYSQLFLARGRYQNFEILQDRDTSAPFGAYPKRDEFALSSLNSNMVLRWEYRPGSNIYVVWSHSRSEDNELNPLAPSGTPTPYDRSIGNRISDTFDIFPLNAFQIKIDYTFLN